MAKTRKELVYRMIRKIAKELECDEQFLADFDASYTFMYEVIKYLPVLSQIEITIKAMTLSRKAAIVKMDKLIAFKLEHMAGSESFTY